MCDIDSKNGEDAALSFTKEYGKDRIIFIKTDVTKEKTWKLSLTFRYSVPVRFPGLSAHFQK
jgi:hypothetical protein